MSETGTQIGPQETRFSNRHLGKSDPGLEPILERLQNESPLATERQALTKTYDQFLAEGADVSRTGPVQEELNKYLAHQGEDMSLWTRDHKGLIDAGVASLKEFLSNQPEGSSQVSLAQSTENGLNSGCVAEINGVLLLTDMPLLLLNSLSATAYRMGVETDLAQLYRAFRTQVEQNVGGALFDDQDLIGNTASDADSLNIIAPSCFYGIFAKQKIIAVNQTGFLPTHTREVNGLIKVPFGIAPLKKAAVTFAAPEAP